MSARTAWLLEEGRARIWEVDVRTGAHRSYATGLRNPNGLAFAQHPEPVLWTAVNGRDGLGSDLGPDYMTASAMTVSSAGRLASTADTLTNVCIRNDRIWSPVPLVPDYALGAHAASLGLAITPDSGLPPLFTAGLSLVRMVRGTDAAEWLSRDLRSLCRGASYWYANRRSNYLPQCGWTGLWPACWDHLWSWWILVADDVGNGNLAHPRRNARAAVTCTHLSDASAPITQHDRALPAGSADNRAGPFGTECKH